jgi:pyruvate/2-oxoacid:ferredoxin oxidoreductase alpha subunit
MENGVDRAGTTKNEATRALARDVFAAVLLTEARISQRVLSTYEAPWERQTNAFGDELTFEAGGDAVRLAKRAAEHAAAGQRVALLGTVEALAAARAELRAIAKARLPVVLHLFAARGADATFATEGLGWCVLLAAGVEDSIDLALVARRAAEDSGTPFVVIHEKGPRHVHLEAVRIPDDALCAVFVGAPAQRLKRSADPAHPVHAKTSDRAFAERAPFALGSAMRSLEAFTGRRHDLLERTSVEGAAVMLVGAGALGEALLGEAERLRAAGYDVGAVKITSLRPFPGPRVVRALARALVVTVLETTDEPLAQSNPLARDVKSAFADALTWAPDYPGVGRLPRIHSGAIAEGEHDLDAGDLDAIVLNMVAGEQGKRLFVYGSDPALKLPSAAEAAPYAASRMALEGQVADLETANACADLAVTVLSSALALKSRVHVRALVSGASFDLVAGRERPRCVAASGPLQLVLLDDLRSMLSGHPLANVIRGSMLAVPTKEASGEGLWNDLPAYVKAIAFDRGVRILGFDAGPGGDEAARRWATASTFVGVVLYAFGRAASGSPIDGSLVARDVADALRAFGLDGARADELGGVARRAFESHVEVARGTVEKDVAAIGLGRSDARAATPGPR